MADRYLVTKSNIKTWKLRVSQFLADGRLKRKPEYILGMYIKVNPDSTIEVENPNLRLGVCPKCQGTGHYIVEGIDKGTCFDCAGRGVLTLRDKLRDESYHTWRANLNTTEEPPAD